MSPGVWTIFHGEVTASFSGMPEGGRNCLGRPFQPCLCVFCIRRQPRAGKGLPLDPQQYLSGTSGRGRARRRPGPACRREGAAPARTDPLCHPSFAAHLCSGNSAIARRLASTAKAGLRTRWRSSETCYSMVHSPMAIIHRYALGWLRFAVSAQMTRRPLQLPIRFVS